jgi:site-specific DNA-methyltransferase (adenine-specific)
MNWTDKITVTNEDNMELMARYPDNYFDLAIVDPPYGIGDFRTQESKKKNKNILWNNEIPNQKYFNELHRVSKNQIIWGVNYYSKFIDSVGRIVHDKTGGGKRNGIPTMSDCDIASHSFGTNMKIFHFVSIGNVIGNTIDFKGELRWHPCQKPIQLYKWLLDKYAKKGDKILDTHLGSGSIAIACHDYGFELTACELDEEYYDASYKRFKNHISQQRIEF